MLSTLLYPDIPHERVIASISLHGRVYYLHLYIEIQRQHNPIIVLHVLLE